MSEYESLNARIAQLVSRNSGLADLANERGYEIDSLHKEIESLRKDAERYRWLRKLERSCFELDSVFDEFGIPLDEKIDLAMAREHNQ